VHRHLAHVLAQVRHAAADPLLHHGPARVVAEQLAGGTGRVEVRRDRPPVEVPDRRTAGGIGDDDKVPGLPVAPRRRLERDLQALADQVQRHRTVEVEALAHRPGGGEHFVSGQFHSGILPRPGFGQAGLDSIGMSTQLSPGAKTITDERTKPSLDEGDHERFAHYVPKDKLTEAMVMGTPVVALCGKVWVPSRDPQRFPVCPECKEIWESLRPGDDEGSDSDK
jgi:Protein of unknown function (DUF3039)